MKPQLLAFYVDGRGFVLDVMRVVELVGNISVEPTPQGPGWLEGNGVLRGQLLPVLRLERLLVREGLPAPAGQQTSANIAARRARGPVIVVRIGEHVLGLRVERVAEVLRPPLEALVPTAPATPYRSKYALGIVTVRGHTYTLLDVRPLAAL